VPVTRSGVRDAVPGDQSGNPNPAPGGCALRALGLVDEM